METQDQPATVFNETTSDDTACGDASKDDAATCSDVVSDDASKGNSR